MTGGPYPWPGIAAAFAAGYGLGSIPFGYLLSRAAGLGDIRAIGSGNIGATNVLRTGRRGLALLTLALDAGKGLVPVLAANEVLGAEASLAAGAGAFFGHLFPVWLGFKGGKGVATFIGVLAGLDWRAALLFCAIWLAVAAAARYSSLAALVAAVLAPFYLALSGASYPTVALVVALALLLVLRHHHNIAKLIHGRESKIGERAS